MLESIVSLNERMRRSSSKSRVKLSRAGRFESSTNRDAGTTAVDS